MSAQVHRTSGGFANPNDILGVQNVSNPIVILGFQDFSHNAILENDTSLFYSSRDCVDFKSPEPSTPCGVSGATNGTLATPPPQPAFNLLSAVPLATLSDNNEDLFAGLD